MKTRIFLKVFLFFTTVSNLFLLSDAASSMAIDLGTEFLKMALVKHGVPMEIVLNRESHRKTPFALTIRQGERFFGSEALKKSVSATRQTYTFFLGLVGKPFNDTAVENYKQKFPYLQLKQNEQRGGVNFVTDSGEIPVETLLAMVLAHARDEVETYATQPVKDVVIAVPTYFGQPERNAVETAAMIAGLNLLQLLSSGASAGLNYGVFRYKDITEEPQILLIYDVGSTSVQATIVQYQLVKLDEEEGKKQTTVPKMELIGVGYDTNIGGHRLTLKLRDFLVKAFRELHPKTENDITSSPQAMAKLLKEADRVKHVLSANQETFAQIESVFQDIDFRTKVMRSNLEEMFSEFEQAHLAPITMALKHAKIELERLDRILLMGAGTRVPRLQEILREFVGSKQLSHNLNTDEAIALGAVYQSARKSKNFIIKRFDVVDYNKTEAETVEEGEQPTSSIKQMDDNEIAKAKAILVEFEEREKLKLERDVALHSLESAVFDYIWKMQEDEFTRFGTKEELESISKSLNEMKEWLDDVPDEMTTEQLKEKRKALLNPIRKLKSRKRQKEERPQYIDKIVKTLEDSEKQMETLRGTPDVFTAVELETFDQLIKTTKDFTELVKKELDVLADNQDATFTTDDIKAKVNALNRESKYLLNKFIIALRHREEAERAEKAKAAAAKKEEEELLELSKVLEEADAKIPSFINATREGLFSEDELNTFRLLVNSTKEWYSQQNETFTADDLRDKAITLNRELQLLSNKQNFAATAIPSEMDEEPQKEAENGSNTEAVGMKEQNISTMESKGKIKEKLDATKNQSTENEDVERKEEQIEKDKEEL